MEKRVRRKFTPEEKLAVLKRHLVGGEQVSAICEEQGLAPNQFYRWQNELFENGAAAFQRNGRSETSRVRKMEDKIEQLEEKVTRKEKIIAEITEEYVQLKKSLGEA